MPNDVRVAERVPEYTWPQYVHRGENHLKGEGTLQAESFPLEGQWAHPPSKGKRLCSQGRGRGEYILILHSAYVTQPCVIGVVEVWPIICSLHWEQAFLVGNGKTHPIVSAAILGLNSPQSHTLGHSSVLIPGFPGWPIQGGCREFRACSLISLLCRLEFGVRNVAANRMSEMEDGLGRAGVVWPWFEVTRNILVWNGRSPHGPHVSRVDCGSASRFLSEASLDLERKGETVAQSNRPGPVGDLWADWRQ